MILHIGDSGSKVLMLQKGLNQLGESLTVDGEFGPKTEAAVERQQSAHGLPVTGVVDTANLSAILAAIKGAPVVPTTPGPVAPTAPSTGGPCHLIDIYHGNNVTSWAKIAASGKVGAICKASQGLSIDSKYGAYRSGALGAGLLFGSYHFMNWDSSGASQADFYADVINSHGGLAKTDFAPQCDWEYADGRAPSSHDINVVKDFMRALQGHFPGRTLGIYASEYLFVHLRDDLGLGDWLSQFTIWVAETGVSKPKGHLNWWLWQYGEGACPGVSDNGVDLDVFNGSLADLKAFIAKT